MAKALPKGRNKYQKNCAVCGEMVAPFKGFLKKNGSVFDVFHEECKDNYNAGMRTTKSTKKKTVKKTDEVEPSNTNALISILERKLQERQKKNEPIVYLPYIIQELHELVELKARMEGLEK